MTVLARCGDWVLVAEGERWTFGRQPGTGGNVMLFVLALLGTIAIVNAGVALVQGWVAGVGVLALGAVLLGLAFVWFRRRNGLRETSPVQPIVVLDLANAVLLGPTGQVLAPLARVVFSKELQLASSARKLECAWPQGQLTVLRGDAFGGSIAPAVDALRSRGFRV